MKVLALENNFLAIDEEFSNYENSQIVILQAPYEHTVSYGGGTKFGPEAIIKASHFVEFYDDEFDRELCFEKGICTLDEINYNDNVDLEALSLLQNEVSSHLNNNKFVVTLGGEHTISSATIKSHFEKFPDMSVLQFDAHSDLREEYQDSIYSHACIMARVKDFFPANRIFQIGIRALCKEEAILIKQKNVNTRFASSIKRNVYGENWVKDLVSKMSSNVYVTFDVDYFDPAIMPSTGTPEPDGFLYNDALEVFREIKRQGKNIIAFDVVELAPVENISHPDILTARLIYKMLNFAF